MAKLVAPDTLQQFDQFKASIGSGNPSAVYWIHGEEQWFLDACIPVIKSLVPEGFEDFNLDVLSGREVKLSRVIDACRTFPMMADRRVVIVRDFLSMFDKRKQSEIDDDGDGGSSNSDELIHYIDQANTTCVLVLLDPGNVPATTKLGKIFRNPNKCSSFEFNRLDNVQIQRWVKHHCKEHLKASIDSDAIELLVDISGNDLLVLSHELSKLAQFAGESQTILAKHVTLLATEHKEATVFEVKDALFSKNARLLFEKAKIVIDAAETPVSGLIGLNAYLSSQYTLLWQIARLNEKGLSKAEISQQIGKAGFYFDNLFRDASRIPASHYPLVFEILLDADAATKGMGHSDPYDVLYTTLRKLLVIHSSN
jgi:DNA polymerase III subunit delta